MKTCPTCHTQYTDESLRFCLQDGTPLEIISSTESSTIWVRDDEVETTVRPKYPSPDPALGVWKKNDGPRVSSPRVSRSKTPFLVAATALATLLILGILGLGAWLYFRGGTNVVQNTPNGVSNRNAASTANLNSTRTPTPEPSPSATPANTNTPTPAPTAAPDINKEEASRQVAEMISDWESLSESGEIDAYMNKYADTVDYYRRRGASADFVRRDKRRAFGMYDSISFDISNMDVQVDDSGDRATATFDKEWEFDGEQRSTGKVRQQLQFRRINGEWRITSERDLKVY